MNVMFVGHLTETLRQIKSIQQLSEKDYSRYDNAMDKTTDS